MKDWEHITHLTDLEKRIATQWLKVVPKNVDGPISGWLVGEMPGPSSNGKLTLFPYPKNSSGGRLQALSGVPMDKYLGRLRRSNLLDKHMETWDENLADDAAWRLRQSAAKDMRIVLLGKRVGQAFGFTKFFDMLKDEDFGAWYTCIPHPSGRSTEYKDIHKRVGARMSLQWAANLMTTPKETK